jgi:uncharacterized protein (TIGR02001 family)
VNIKITNHIIFRKFLLKGVLKMRKSLITVAVLGALSASSFVFAAEKEAKSDFTTSGSVGLFSQYIFRGLTQTDRRPALQGNFDINHSSGLYLGAWASNVSSGGSLEIDIYGGFKTDLGKSGFGVDLGALQYYYPGKENPANFGGNPKLNTTELYGAINYHWVQAKISGVVSKDAWGFGKYGDGSGNDADGTYYAELNANVPIGEYMGAGNLKGLTGLLHIARQDFRGLANSPASYNDWKLGLQNTFDNGVVVGAYYTDTNIKNDNVLWVYNSNNLGRETGTVFVQKTF